MTHWPDPECALDQYQALRRQALENASWGSRGHGLSLFLTQGMAAWLRALSPRAPRPAVLPSADAPSGRPALPIGARSDMTRVLAQMVIAVGWEGQ